jgi:NO-binding membrane sensor protein with MHYT domain/two-component sensor histidine kinase
MFMETGYNFNFVVLSIIVAILASYVAFELATVVTQAKGRAKGIWLSGGGIAMGLGIWSMHFIGMLAFHMHGMSIAYDVNLMLLSIIVAVTASALALYIVSRQVVTTSSVIAGGLIMAIAISGMHYIGMFSMRMGAKIQWSLPLLVLSVVIALVASFLALSVSIRVRNSSDHGTRKILASFLMGAAISGMHYTGMSAASFIPAEGAYYRSSDLVASETLTIIIVVMTVFILGLALLSSAVDRAMATKTKRIEESTQLYKAEKKMALGLRQEKDTRERFVSALAHDLRTPLAAAMMSAQLCGQESKDPRVVELLSENMISSLKRIEEMIEELLDANRISAGQSLSLNVSNLNICEFAGRILENLKTIHGPRFILHCEKNLEAVWDAKYMGRAIENLCTNAVKYGKKNAPITIKITPSSNGFLQISVHNEGRELSPEEIQRLFGLFYRGESNDTNGEHGWGIGLTIVRGVTEAHGGTVQVKSSKTSGSAFILEVPLAVKDQRAHAVSNEVTI